MKTSSWRVIALLASGTLLSGLLTAAASPAVAAGPTATAKSSTMDDLVPEPVLVQPNPAVTFQLTGVTLISVPLDEPDVQQVADLLAADLRPATGFHLPVVTVPGFAVLPGISLALVRADDQIGTQGYRLDVTAQGVRIQAATTAGLLNGIETLRQLLPAGIEQQSVQNGPWTVPGGHIVDQPRYPYRGAMLDVARYFFPVDFVERYIDELSYYKINYLHLHLTDDQGWRIQIDSWPRLATYGGSTAIAGRPGGYYTKDQYRQIVQYAAQRGITVIPEIDLPGHTTAALASYAELNCDGVAPPLYTGWGTGFSSLCLSKPVTLRFVNDVIREVAAMTPGRLIDIGGDEVPSNVSPADYAAFMKATAAIVASYGKQVMGWSDMLQGVPPAGATAQYWYPWPDDTTSAQAAQGGAKFVMSPADYAYMDMSYTATEPQYGETWAGYIEAKDAYSWDPDTTITGVGPSSVLGVEATLFTTLTPDAKSVQFMVFPRMPEIAEVGWTPKSEQSWPSMRVRLAAQGQRWDIWGVNYYHSPQIPWQG